MDFHTDSICGRRDSSRESHSPTCRPTLELSQRPVVGEAGVAGVLQEEGFQLGSGFQSYAVGLQQELPASSALTAIHRASRPNGDALLLRLQMVLLEIIAQACDSKKYQVSVDCIE